MSQVLKTTIALASLVLALPATSAAGDVWAIVIGVDKYDHFGNTAQLRFCVNDAELFKTTLVDHGGLLPNSHLKMFCQSVGSSPIPPTYENLTKTIPDFLEDVGEDDTVIFYFSGHGLLGSDGESYLAPKDCRPGLLDKTALKLAWVRTQLENCPAKLRLMFIDACYSGNPAGNVRNLNGKAIQEVLQGSPSIYTIASCDARERSLEWPEKEHGVFTYWLCRGMQGAADRDGDARVSLDELYSFVLSRVPRTAKRLAEAEGKQHTQTPVRFLGGNKLGVPVLELQEVRPADALRRVAELLDDLIRDEYVDAHRRRVGLLEFSNRVGDDFELRGELGSFGVLAAESVQDHLLEHCKSDYIVQGRRFVANFVAAIDDRPFGVKDLSHRLEEIAERKNHPETLILGNFQRRPDPDRLQLTCELLDVATGATVAKVSTTMLVNAELWTMLGKSVEVPTSAPAPAPAAAPAPAGVPKRLKADDLDRLVKKTHPLLDNEKAQSPIALTIRKGQAKGSSKFPVSLNRWAGRDQDQAVFGVSVGDEFEIEIENVTDENLAVIVLVDGLNVLGAQRAGAVPLQYELVSNARPWLFPRGTKQIIDGWHFEVANAGQNGNQEFDTHKFITERLQNSLAGQCDYTDQVGQITVLVYGTQPAGDAGARGIGVGAGAAGRQVFGVIDDWTINRDDLRAVYHVRYVEESLIAAAQLQR